MNNFTKKITMQGLKFLFLTILMITLTLNSFSQDDDSKITIDNWLHLGDFEVAPPAFHQQENMDGATFEPIDLMHFNYLHLCKLQPEEGKEVLWKTEPHTWSKIKTAKDGFAKIGKKEKYDANRIAYLAAYIHNDQWLKAELEVSSHQMLEVYFDGKKIKSKDTDNRKDEDAGNINTSIKVEKGTHLLLIKTLKTKENNVEWDISANLKIDKDLNAVSLIVDLLPQETMTIHHLLNGEFINGASISADGELVMLRFSETAPPDGDRQSWTEVRNLESGKLIQSFRETKMTGMEWLPTGKAISYETSDKEKGSSLWVFDFSDMSIKKILNDVEDFGSYTWSGDASFIIYTVSEEFDEKNKNLKLFEGMPDQWPWWRNRSFLYKLDVASGVNEKLTYGYLSTDLMDIRDDGQKILFSQSTPDFSERPYSKQYLMEMDLENYSIDTIWVKQFGGSCQYTPDGTHLLVTSSPAMFGNTGVNVTGDVIPNDYDTQAYLYDMTSGDVDPITFNFNPSIQQAVFSKYDENKIYFLAQDRTYKKIFYFDLNTRYFEEIPTGFDVVNSMSLSDKIPMGVFTGSSISTPKYAVSVNLTDGKINSIANPRAETYKNVVFGETEEWNFTNKNGVEIEGRIYFPPDFDKNKKYPLIVYYYAGTSPTERSFGGRYPKNIFAAQGYVVYNLQPSGATGYGQDFSAAHVNNWGITVADEIIDGTKLFLDDHVFIAKDKVGCIGASYGGFMTMLLQTRTDIFAAAISHAGISSIASYWGEGYWGYLYSSVASANSFPWNNKKLYVEQSALFNADKINTPLLLLHGGSDTNVPPGESIQLYTALKLLGKPVELIEVKGQDHHIVDYEKRIEWQNTIFAWFDKWLKDQPAWWNDLYPDRNL